MKFGDLPLIFTVVNLLPALQRYVGIVGNSDIAFHHTLGHSPCIYFYFHLTF